MSKTILSMLRHEVSSSLSFLAFINGEVTKSYEDSLQAKRKLTTALARGKASDKEISEFRADVALKESCYVEKRKYIEYAEPLLEKACADLIEYAIEICVPEQYRKDAKADYVSGSTTIDVFWGENDAAHYVLDLCTKEIKHIKELQP